MLPAIAIVYVISFMIILIPSIDMCGDLKHYPHNWNNDAASALMVVMFLLSPITLLVFFGLGIIWFSRAIKELLKQLKK